MEPADRELLTGMGNCFEACGADFPETLRMVSEARRRTPEDVLATLQRLRKGCSADPEYQRLRARFPAEFPV